MLLYLVFMQGIKARCVPLYSVHCYIARWVGIIYLCSETATWWQRWHMANVHLQPPEAFNSRSPDDWPKRKRQFEQFRSTSGLTAEAEEHKSARCCTPWGKKQTTFWPRPISPLQTERNTILPWWSSMSSSKSDEMSYSKEHDLIGELIWKVKHQSNTV